MPTTRVFTHGPTFASNGPGIALAAPYHAGRVAHETVVLNDGRVLLVGGREYQPGLYYGLPSLDAYDPASDSWERLGQMPSIPGEDGAYGGRGFPGVTLLRSGQVLIFGGNSGELLEHEANHGGVTYTGAPGNSRGSSLLFDPSTRVFTRVGDLNVQRFGPFAAPWRGGAGAFAIGGSPRGRAGMPHPGEVYDPATRAWFLLPPEPEQEPDFPRREGVTLADGTVLTWTGETTTVRRLLPDG
jgi:hypothetical protein